MTFYPDGPPEIPNQTPIPGQQQAAPGQRMQRAIRSAAVVNGAILAVAVVLAYVVPVTEDEDQRLGIVIGAAALCALIMTITLLGQSRRRSATPAAIPAPSPSSTSAGTRTADLPYGAVPVADASGFRLTVEDVFSITGRGTVVTGRVAAGEVREGQRVRLIRGGQVLVETEVAGVEMFRRLHAVGTPGDNVGILLAGVARDQVRSGDELIT